jgi:hypothetical protein
MRSGSGFVPGCGCGRHIRVDNARALVGVRGHCLCFIIFVFVFVFVLYINGMFIFKYFIEIKID